METGAPDVSLLYGGRFLVLLFPSRGASVPGFREFVKNDERKISNVSGRAQRCAKFMDRREGRCPGNCKEVYARVSKKCRKKQKMSARKCDEDQAAE
jgi:hypothetical protein